jgi:hypothetical protein
VRALAVATVLVITLAATSGEAEAGRTATKAADQDADGDVTVTVERDGTVTRPGTSGGGRLDCRIHHLRPDTTQLAVGDRATSLEVGIGYWLLCDDSAGNRVVSRLFLHEPGVAPIDPEELARRARDQLQLLHPVPHTSPAMGLHQIVGIDTWMWLEPGSWEPLTATASIPGLSISAAATPEEVTWDMGDGTVVRCEGPGTPYDESLPEALQSTDCSHLYLDRGRFTASATVSWSVRWSSSDGDGGRLDDARRTTEFPMAVIERQAVRR